MVTKKREQKYPQLQQIRLGPEYAWIASELGKQPEGVGGAVRAVLREVLGSRGRKDLDVLYMIRGAGEVAAVPPTRLVAGYDDLLEVIDLTRAALTKRLGYGVSRADVVRTALWDGLEARGSLAPKRPANVFIEILKRPETRQSELARELGLERHIVQGAMETLGLVESERPLSGDALKIALRKGLSQTKAAEMLGVSQKTIAVTRQRHGYVTPPERRVHANRYTDRQKAIAIRPDLSFQEALRKTGMSAAGLARLRHKAGLTKSRKPTDAQRAIILDPSLTYAEAAKKSGFSTTTVYRIRAQAARSGRRKKS